MSLYTRLRTQSRDAAVNTHTALRFAVSSGRRRLLTVAVASAVFVGMVYAGFPGYSYQMLTAGVWNGGVAFVTLVELLYAEQGGVGVGATVAYVWLTGTVVVVLIGRTGRVTSDSADGWVAVASAVVVGCASCGAGLLGLVGGVGVLATVPVSGLGIRFVGIGFALLFLSRHGAPDSCSL